MRTRCVKRAPVEAEVGQDAAEYGLLVGFVAIVIVVGVSLFGVSLAQFWNDIVIVIDAMF